MSEKKNVAIIISKLNGGGAERCASNLSVELSKKHKVFLILFDGKNITYPYGGTLIDLAIPSSDSRCKRFFNVFKRILAIRKIKKENNIDVSISLMDGSNIVNVLSKVKDRIIVSVRIRLSSANRGWVGKKLIRFCSRKADMTVALSKMVKVDLINAFDIPKDKVTTIYNHCDVELLHSLTADSLKPDFIDDESVYIVTMGRLAQQKGHWHLIRAFSEVVKEIPNAKLIIMGEGPLEEALKKLAEELKIGDNVILPGYITNPHSVLQYCDMFVFPSIFEGLGNVLLEALAFEMPIISCDCPSGPREILAPNTDFYVSASEMEQCEYGVLVPVVDGLHFNAFDELTYEEKEMAKAILLLYKDEKLRNKYKVKSKERIKDFSNESIINEWEKVIFEEDVI